MANQISVSVRTKSNLARYVMLGLLGSSAIFTLASLNAKSYTGIWWTVTFCFVTATIYVYNRYVGSEYIYSVNNDSGIPSFEITMRIGKTARTMARLDLYTITEVRKVSGQDYRAHKCEKGTLKYSYFPTMRPAELYLVLVRSPHENADVFVEINEELASVLTNSF